MLVAALVMMTRISIKVRLAWSTNAQMGLMLVECALGLYELALLHMLAHSCYKAFAFLNSGEAVTEFLRAQHSAKRLPSLRGWFVAALVALPSVALLVSLSGASLLPLSPWLIVATALTVFLTQLSAVGGRQQIAYSLYWCLVLLGSYWAFKTILAPVIPSHEHTYSGLFDMWMLSLFAILLLGYLQLQYSPQSTSSHRLFIALNAGFYLDEWLTRLTLKLWPLPRTRNTTSTISHGVV
jgi:NAD(P)H-quinone oxidoreductase subunit 5